jgi:sugar phosphate isomerase/epimerase
MTAHRDKVKASPERDRRARLHVAFIKDPEVVAGLAVEHGVGLEIQAFAYPEDLGERYESELERFAGVFDGFPNGLVLHGPFIDLNPGSSDPEIVELTRRRYLQGIHAARVLRAARIVFHTQFQPGIFKGRESEAAGWLDRNFAFWPELVGSADEAGIEVAIEHVYDETPEITRRLVEGLDRANVGAVLDTGHVVAFSKCSTGEWVDALAPWLTYVHLSDNDGTADQHHALGTGVFDFAEFFRILDQRHLAPDLTIEVDDRGHEGVLESLALLGRLGLPSGL